MKRKVLAAGFIILLFGVCLVVQKSYYAAATIERPLPGTEKPANEVLVSAIPQAGETKKDTVTSAGSAADSHATIQLAPRPNYSTTAPAQQEVSFSQKREIKERTLMPGVSYEAGEGINMALDEDEKIQIKRDSTYRSKEVQVMWKKTF